jgi:hypothetical protein
MKVKSKIKSRFLHSGTAKTAVPPVGMTTLFFWAMEKA